MDVLGSYLMMPFIGIFGLNLVTIRLPQAIISCLAALVFYLLLKEVWNKRFAILGTFLFAVCPWQIVMSRLNIESSLLADFLIFATYFFVKGIERKGYLLLSSVMYGLSLYAYAVVWPVLPFIILVDGIYAVRHKKLSLKCWQVIASITILAVMALPLMLFMLVNEGLMDEIRLSFISIPRLAYMRNEDISLASLPDNVVNMLTMLTRQQVSSGNDQDSFGWYGLFYKYSTPLYIIGGCIIFSVIEKSVRLKEYDRSFFIAVWLGFMLVLGAMLPAVSIVRLNGLYPVIICCMTIGVMLIFDKISHRIGVLVILAYCLSFVCFVGEYVTLYDDYISDIRHDGEGESISCAESLTDGLIYVDGDISFANVLYYTKMPVEEFIDTVEYVEFPAAYMEASSYGRFRRYDGQMITEDMVVVLLKGNLPELDEAQFDIREYGDCAVVRCK